jgi:hypothetical protein
MTLMDAPKYDAARAARRTRAVYFLFAGLFVFLIASWFFTGRPVDYPWNWWTYYTGTRAADKFLSTIEKNDLPDAYGIWVHDPQWQQHPASFKTYPYSRFEEDWGQASSANDYGTITSHHIVAKKVSGGVLIVGSMINGRKSKPLFLAYDKRDHTLGFSPFELKLD